MQDYCQRPKRSVERQDAKVMLERSLPIRERLIKATKDKDWADIKSVQWGNKESFKNHRLSMYDHCAYKYVMYIKGTSNSGRPKCLQTAAV
jgi:hypothetical protein